MNDLPKVARARLLFRNGATYLFLDEKTTLSVNVINPPFWETIARDPNAPQAKQWALDVAVVARDALSSRGGYDGYEVVFTRQREAWVTISKFYGFSFQASELPARIER